MIHRSQQTRIPGALGCAAAVSLLISGCGDSPAVDLDDYARYCVDRPVNRTVDENNCETGNAGDDPNGRFGWYYQQLQPHHYSGDYDDTPDYVFLPYGSPIYSGGSYVRPGNYATHAPLTRPRGGTSVARPKAPPGYAGFNKPPGSGVRSGATNPNIQRGGFGGPSGSSSSRGFTGSSGS